MKKKRLSLIIFEESQLIFFQDIEKFLRTFSKRFSTEIINMRISPHSRKAETKIFFDVKNLFL